MIKSFLQAAAMILVPGTALAFFCPNNFQDIQIGESQDSVLQKCGKPDSQKEIAPANNGPQEWIFNITTAAGQGSLRMSVMIQDNKVLNIFANGMSMPSTSICGTAVSVGTTADQLKAACGMPTLINKGTPSANSPPPMVEMLYNSRPPITLIFEDGKLKERKQGTSGPPQFTTTK